MEGMKRSSSLLMKKPIKLSNLYGESTLKTQNISQMKNMLDTVETKSIDEYKQVNTYEKQDALRK